jgi:hypothetical protein
MLDALGHFRRRPANSWLLGLSRPGNKHAPSRQQGASAILGFTNGILRLEHAHVRKSLG